MGRNEDVIMNSPKPSVKRLLVKLNLTLQGNTLRYLKQIEDWQWLNHIQNSVLQKDRLKNLLMHAYHHVPFYRETLKNSGVVKNQNTIDLAHFHRIPLLDKAKIRYHFDYLESDDLSNRKWHKNSSGGSTGQPITFIQDSYFSDWSSAVSILYDAWTGYSFSDRKILLWGSIRDLSALKESLKNRLIKWLRNDVWLNAFLMTPDEMHAYVKRINQFKPIQILSYAESIYELSRFIEREGLRVYSPRAIMTSAGTLFPHMRDTIGRIFKAPVFNRYGSREVGAIASECEHHHGLHVCIPTHYVEIIRSDGNPTNPGEVGEIVVTSLVNYAMPLIRYRIGDMGMWSDHLCSCGRTWPLLKEVSGRVTDVFYRRDTAIVSPEYLIHLIGIELNNGWIQKFQVVQEDYDHLCVSIVTIDSVNDPKTYYSDEIKKITEGIHLVMGENCKVEYKFVSDIEHTVSGKYRYTISKIAR